MGLKPCPLPTFNLLIINELEGVYNSTIFNNPQKWANDLFNCESFVFKIKSFKHE